MKLAMAMNVSRSGAMIMDLPDLQKAIDTLDQVEIKMKHTFSGVGKSTYAETIPYVVSVIANAENEGISHEDLMARFYRDLDTWEMEKVLNTMEQSGYIRIKRKPKVKGFKGATIYYASEEKEVS